MCFAPTSKKTFEEVISIQSEVYAMLELKKSKSNFNKFLTIAGNHKDLLELEKDNCNIEQMLISKNEKF